MKEKDNGFKGILLAVGYLFMVILMEYYPWYVQAFGEHDIFTKIYIKCRQIGLVKSGIISRLIVIVLLFGGNMAYKPRKNEDLDKTKVYLYFMGFSIIFVASGIIEMRTELFFYIRILFMMVGFIGLMLYTMRLFQVMEYDNKAKSDPFNDQQETFRQTEKKIETEHSANIPYTYTFDGKLRNGWMNLINIFRALLLVGTPGSGKTFAVIEEIMRQLLNKRFAMMVYSFKRDDLVTKAHGYLEEAKEKNDPKYGYRKFPRLFRINFDDPRYSNRCNPMSAHSMRSKIDAMDNASTLMKNLNKEWIKKSDYFSKSAISFTGACNWFMKKKSEEYGKNICTLGHIAILSTITLDVLMKVMMADSEVRNILVPFRDALEREAMDQLSGQTSTVQISLSNIMTKEICYITSGNEFDLKANDRSNPKVICLQNNPDRQEVYSSPLGLYVNNILKAINSPKRTPMAVIIDELPTIFVMMLRTIIDTGRENLIATVLGIQSVAQLILDYGKELSDVLYDNCANFICGASKGETARRLSELFGKIHQEKISKNANSNDVGTNFSTQMMELLPKSKIAAMSTGTFAALVADTFENKIKEKKCYGELKPDIEVKKRIKKHRLPKIREFRPSDFDEQVGTAKKLLFGPSMELLLKNLFREPIAYHDFYFGLLPELLGRFYKRPQVREDLILLVKKIKLYDYFETLAPLMEADSVDIDRLKFFLTHVIEEAIELEEMDRQLSAYFEEVISDVDALIKLEYQKITGKVLESAIFDEKKINGDIAEVLDDAQIAVNKFMTEYDSALKSGVHSGLSDMDMEKDMESVPDPDLDGLRSSYPVETID